eukprot:3925970-Rhodomonas_salina.1
MAGLARSFWRRAASRSAETTSTSHAFPATVIASSRRTNVCERRASLLRRARKVWRSENV